MKTSPFDPRSHPDPLPAGEGKDARKASPAVSVVIPTYNHRAYLPESLGSVFAQTFTNYEIIVVNDGSPDDSRDYLRPLADAGRIRYVEQENQGQAAARNRGIGLARGEFIALLDDDDRWTPDKLAWQVAALRESPRAVLAYGDYARLEASGELSPYESKQCPSGEVHRAFLNRNWILTPGQTLIRTSAMREIGGFDSSIWGSDDWDLYLRLARRGEFIYQPRLCLHYRMHGANASRRALRLVKNHWKVVRRHIGWNLPRLAAHQRAASTYFVPNLLAFAHRARMESKHGQAMQAYGCALTFRPSLLLRKTFWAGALGAALQRPPRHPE